MTAFTQEVHWHEINAIARMDVHILAVSLRTCMVHGIFNLFLLKLSALYVCMYTCRFSYNIMCTQVENTYYNAEKA